MSQTTTAFEPLIHDVKAACGNLRAAADLLRDIPPRDAEEMLCAMARQAEGLARKISGFKQARGQAG